jgi:hypothetical protein
MQELDEGNEAVRRLLEAAGERYDEKDRDLLYGYATDLMAAPESDQIRFGEMVTIARRGFFHCAARGDAFVSLDRFAEEFGLSIDENYPGAGPAFLRMATSYWTLRMLEGRLRRRYAGVGIQQLLLAIEQPLGQLFFADTEDHSMEPADRATMQRVMIEESGAPIDAEEFLFGNPLLMGNPLA